MSRIKANVQAQQYLERALELQDSIEALLPERQAAVRNVRIDHIRFNSYQARQKFEGLELLVHGIRMQGFSSRLNVRPDPSQPGYYQLVFGERWLRAAKTAGLESVPCRIATYSDEEMFELGMAENIRQRDLDPLEEAFAFRTIIEQRDCSIHSLAERLGQENQYIIDRLALLIAPDDPFWITGHLNYHAPAPAAAAAPAPKTRFDVQAPPQQAESSPAPAASNNHHEPQAGAAPPPWRDQTLSNPSESLSQIVRPPPAAQARNNYVATPPNHIRRTVERDIRTLRAIFARWRDLIDRGETEQAILFAYLDELKAEVERMAKQRQRQSLPPQKK